MTSPHFWSTPPAIDLLYAAVAILVFLVGCMALEAGRYWKPGKR
jgi:hypothetical protein